MYVIYCINVLSIYVLILENFVYIRKYKYIKIIHYFNRKHCSMLALMLLSVILWKKPGRWPLAVQKGERLIVVIVSCVQYPLLVMFTGSFSGWNIVQ